MYPEDLKYTPEHEWVRPVESAGSTGSTGSTDSTGSDVRRLRVGITHYAQDALGDVVFVTLPAVGAEVSAGQPCGELESTKSVSDVYAPVSGTVATVNEALDSTPELLNTDPYGEGWMLEIQPSDPDALGTLLDVEDYRGRLHAG